MFIVRAAMSPPPRNARKLHTLISEKKNSIRCYMSTVRAIFDYVYDLFFNMDRKIDMQNIDTESITLNERPYAKVTFFQMHVRARIVDNNWIADIKQYNCRTHTLLYVRIHENENFNFLYYTHAHHLIMHILLRSYIGHIAKKLYDCSIIYSA